MLDGKNKELVYSFEKMTNENRDEINRFRSENDRLNQENMELISKVSKLTNEIDSLKTHSEKVQ